MEPDQKLKIIFVPSSIYPKPGGVAIHVQNLAFELTNLGHNVTVYSINENFKPQKNTLENFNVIYISLNN